MMRSATMAMLFLGGWVAMLGADDKPKAGGDQAKALAEMQQRMLQQFDINKDGVLSDQEQLLAQEAMRKQGWPGMAITPGGFPGSEQFLKQFDKDGDGQLSETEKLAAMAAFQRMRGNGKGTVTGGLPRMGGVGTPGGALPAPVAPAVAAGEIKNAKVSPLVKRFDKDGDGKLNDEEKAAAQAELNKGKGKDKADAKAKSKDAKKADPKP